eukprot:TRINITY_DN2113_c0_g1_i2.p1 TRINITY_DN2113_c0_g1~~TRINITY_DN2113_c0_g1_i2.p1  ORF type:complete len:245 (+),score=22.77 TRINITY_DN2113_c0_g1_i2:448-1182(+)
MLCRTPLQVVGGHLGLVMPSLQELEERLKRVSSTLADTKFSWKRQTVNGTKYIPEALDEYIQVTCPWGNQFRVYQVPVPDEGIPELSVRYVEEICHRGTAVHIASFYSKYFEALTRIIDYHDPSGEKLHIARVRMGPKQHVFFKEVTEEVPEWSGYHIAIYIGAFSKLYKRFDEKELLHKGNRFSDNYDTLEDALRCHQFRVSKIRADKRTVHVLEHEIRSLNHPSYMRPLVNRFGGYGVSVTH